MNITNWDDLRFFLTAARCGSLSAASRALGSNQPTVGRRIDALEKILGQKLFQRHAQGLTLTAAGLRIMHAAEAMDSAAADLARLPDGEPGSLCGVVRISAPEGLGVHVLAPALTELTRYYPALNLVMEASAASADLARGAADIAVRLYRPEAADLVVRRVCDLHFGLYAAPSYLLQHGTPTFADELHGHHFIGYGEQLVSHAESCWLETLAGTSRFVLRSDNTLARLNAACTGLGIAVLPKRLVTGTALQHLLPAIAPPSRTIWLVVHRDLQHVPRIRVVLEYLAALLQEAV